MITLNFTIWKNNNASSLRRYLIYFSINRPKYVYASVSSKIALITLFLLFKKYPSFYLKGIQLVLNILTLTSNHHKFTFCIQIKSNNFHHISQPTAFLQWNYQYQWIYFPYVKNDSEKRMEQRNNPKTEHFQRHPFQW